MKLDNFNSLEHNKNNEPASNILTSFMKELQNIISNCIKNPSLLSSNSIVADSIYVIRDINDENLSLINIDDGKEVNIYLATSKQKMEELHSQGIFDNVYEISKEDFYSLNLGSNITIKNGKCVPYIGEVKIKNPEAAAKLEDMYFCLDQEKHAVYSVSEISDEKIYLTDTKEGGYFSIPKEAYPDFKVGDLLKNVDGRYVLI